MQILTKKILHMNWKSWKLWAIIAVVILLIVAIVLFFTVKSVSQVIGALLVGFIIGCVVSYILNKGEK